MKTKTHATPAAILEHAALHSAIILVNPDRAARQQPALGLISAYVLMSHLLRVYDISGNRLSLIWNSACDFDTLSHNR